MTKEIFKSLTETEFFSLVEKTFPSKWVNSILIKYDTPKIIKPNKKLILKMHLFTETNEYIFDIFPEDHRETSDQKTHLGCTVQSRKERAGETFKRGRDLQNGACNEETWNKILKEILLNELVKIHPDSRRKIHNIEVSNIPDSKMEMYLDKLKDEFENKKIPSQFESEQATIAGNELFKYLGTPPYGNVTIGTFYNKEGKYDLIVYVSTTDRYQYFLNKRPEIFLGHNVYYQECNMPIAYGTIGLGDFGN